MAANDLFQKPLIEMQKLFSELDEVYGRLSAALQLPSYGNEAATQVKITEERRKASDIIQRIRDLQGL